MKTTTLLFLLLGLTIVSCHGPKDVTTSPKPKEKKVNIDSLAQVKADSIFKAKLGNTPIKSSFNRPQSNNVYLPGDEYKDEVYTLPGMILMLRKKDSIVTIEETGYFVRKPDAKIDVEIKVDKPYFSSVIEKGFKTNIDVMGVASANLDAKTKLSMEYKLIQTVILETKELDINKADSIIDKVLKPRYLNDTTVLAYYIVRSANLNIFSYTKFIKLEGKASANGMAFQVGAETYYDNKDEVNTFELVLKGITRQKVYDKSNTQQREKWIEFIPEYIITK